MWPFWILYYWNIYKCITRTYILTVVWVNKTSVSIRVNSVHARRLFVIPWRSLNNCSLIYLRCSVRMYVKYVYNNISLWNGCWILCFPPNMLGRSRIVFVILINGISFVLLYVEPRTRCIQHYNNNNRSKLLLSFANAKDVITLRGEFGSPKSPKRTYTNRVNVPKL